MGLCDSCCCTSPRNDTTTSGAEINLSWQEDKTNHLLQESHLIPVSKSTRMNGFCKDCTATCFFPLFSAVLQIEVCKVCSGSSPGVAFGIANAVAQEMLLHARDLAPAGMRQGVLDWGWMKLRAWDTRAREELEAKIKLQWYVCARAEEEVDSSCSMLPLNASNTLFLTMRTLKGQGQGCRLWRRGATVAGAPEGHRWTDDHQMGLPVC